MREQRNTDWWKERANQIKICCSETLSVSHPCSSGCELLHFNSNSILWWLTFCFVSWYDQKTCRRVTLISCKSCSSVLGEAVAPGMRRCNRSPTVILIFKCGLIISWLYPSETLKLYITQVVVESAVGDRKLEATLNRQVFFSLSHKYKTTQRKKIIGTALVSSLSHS